MIDELFAEGWEYRDLPRMTPKAMEKFVGIVDEKEIQWLTRVCYENGAVRGQLLISPQGMRNMKSFVASQKDLTTALLI
jgi:hypothetical protein